MKLWSTIELETESRSIKRRCLRCQNLARYNTLKPAFGRCKQHHTQQPWKTFLRAADLSGQAMCNSSGRYTYQVKTNSSVKIFSFSPPTSSDRIKIE